MQPGQSSEKNGNPAEPLVNLSASARLSPIVESLADRPDKTPSLINTRDRIAIFIDGASLFYAAMQLQIEIDYIRLLVFLTHGRRLLRAYFYTGSDRHNEKQQGFLLWMRRNGYRVVTKELVQLPDGSRKANLDVEMAIDMLMLADHCDTMVLVTGDGDLAYVVNAVTYRGVTVEVVSLRSMTSDALINVADQFTDLAGIQQHIQKQDS